MENMVKLNELNEPTILHSLRARYRRDDIYTYVGTILIAVNPFKLLPLYTPQIQDLYKSQVCVALCKVLAVDYSLTR